MKGRMRGHLMIGLSLAAMLLSVITFGFVVRARPDPVMTATDDVVAQINAIGGSLAPGERASIQIPRASRATEVIVLPAYCSEAEVEQSLVHHSSAFRETVFRASQDDRISPAFVWANADEILAICHARFTVALDIRIRVVDLTIARSVTVVKETRSLNPFLSLRLE
jgi:hypothetical protein